MRIIARLDIKGPNLIKGIQFEGLRVIGDPNKYALKYYDQGADELIFIDAVASLYERNNLVDIIKKASNDVFIPITVGGGIRSIEDAEKLFLNGADKIAINTAAIQNPNLINELVKNFGSQAIVISIQAKFISDKKWTAYVETGREKTDKDVIEWLNEAIDRGAGEVLITSVDHEGTKKGFDLNLYEEANKHSKVPFIFSGGMKSANDLIELAKYSECNGVAAASILHYNDVTIQDIKKVAIINNLKVRR